MIRKLVRLVILASVLSAMYSPALPLPVVFADQDTAWYAEYYDNMTLAGRPAVVRQDAAIDFDWGIRSPAPGVPSDHFSARWTRTVKLEWGGNYRFYINTDDGVRVWVDGLLLLDQWFERQDAWTTADIYLEAGTHTFRVEYFENIGSALAQVVFMPENNGIGAAWRAEYFANPDLEDEPALIQLSPHIAFNWGGGSPAYWIHPDWFSALYLRSVVFLAGTYQFIVATEGGVRLYVDDVLILDKWEQVGKITYTANTPLKMAVHQIRLEYTHTWRDASLSLRWLPVGATGPAPSPPPAPTAAGGWKGEYFGAEIPNTTPTFVRDDAAIDFDWGDNPPFVGMPRERWSARWTRTVNFAAGYYRFTTVTDDGVRLWVDDKSIIDRWEPNDSQPFFGDASLSAGPHTVVMEFYNLTGGAAAHLGWTRMDTTDTAAVVDDGSVGFSAGGASSGWNTAYSGYGGRSRWTYNRAGFWARWMPALPRLGRYEVLVNVPWTSNATRTARYYLKHEGDVAEFTIDQQARAGQWVSLGIYGFNANDTEWVHLDAITPEAAGTRTVGFDAVKWLYRGQ